MLSPQHFGLIACLLIVWSAAIHDIRTQTIPHGFSYALMGLWIPFTLFTIVSGTGFNFIMIQALGGLIAFIIGISLFSIGVMGGGDVKLLAALAPLIPFNTLHILFVLIAFSGLFWALFYAGSHYLRAKRRGRVEALNSIRRLRMPYGPSIAIGLTLYAGAAVALA